MSRILGYANRISVAPDEAIEFMVSCDGLESYDATLIRVIQGDTNPEGPGYKEEKIRIDLGGPFKGRFQPIHAGSYAEVADAPVFKTFASIGVQVFIWPSLPGKGQQTILSRLDPASGTGFCLGLDETGSATFSVTSPVGETKTVSTRKPLLSERWYLVSASFCSDTGDISVFQRPLREYSQVDGSGKATVKTNIRSIQPEQDTRVFIAARPAVEAPCKEHFNGRIESPRLYSRILQPSECRQLLPGNEHSILADWDFSIGISTDQIADVSGNKSNGRLINLPTRGIPGQAWNGEEYCWTKRPEHYGAIHFHDDDLYDCGWEKDFELIVPSDLKSAVYAIHLHGDGEDYYIPFAVRPPRGTRTSPIAFLMPTASYLAYANNRIGIDVPETEIVSGRLIQINPIDQFMQEHPELGLCFYDLHNDGSGVYYSSRLRPVVNMQPKHIAHLGGVGSNVWQFNADTHILDWLEQLDQPFDVITDEDLEVDGVSALEGYKAVITGSHPEYYSLSMMDGLRDYTDQGGRLMYLGGNGFYWRVSYHPTLPGVIECRKSEDGIRAFAPMPGEFYASFTGEYTGLWRRNGRPPNELAGIGMVSQGFDVSAPYVRTEASNDPRASFIFEGVDSQVLGDFGLSGGGAAGLELDATDHALGTPPNTLVLARSEQHTDIYLLTPEDMNDPAPGFGGTEAEVIRAEMVFFETHSGGAVFSTGSIAWAGSLSHNAYNNDIARITTNVLKRFQKDEPFPNVCQL